jgi:hypothetical protein
METLCSDCGTSNYEGSRYCRKCGRTLVPFEVSEATTRTFDDRTGRPFAEPDAEPRYVPPPEGTPPGGLAAPTGFRPAAGTNPLDARKPPAWPFWAVLVVALLVVGAVVGTFAFRLSGASRSPVAEAPRASEPRPTPPREAAPDADPDPDPDPDVDVDVDVDPDASDPLREQVPERARQWVYPGAETQAVNDLPGGQVILELATDDDLAEVARFYGERFKGRSNTIRRVERGEAQFVSPDVIVTVEEGGADDGSTGIKVVLNPGGGFVPQVPPIGPPPAPPAPPAAPPAPSR